MNFFKILYCDIGADLGLFALLALFVIYLVFQMTNIIIEKYVASSITRIR